MLQQQNASFFLRTPDTQSEFILCVKEHFKVMDAVPKSSRPTCSAAGIAN